MHRQHSAELQRTLASRSTLRRRGEVAHLAATPPGMPPRTWCTAPAFRCGPGTWRLAAAVLAAVGPAVGPAAASPPAGRVRRRRVQAEWPPLGAASAVLPPAPASRRCTAPSAGPGAQRACWLAGTGAYDGGGVQGHRGWLDAGLITCAQCRGRGLEAGWARSRTRCFCIGCQAGPSPFPALSAPPAAIQAPLRPTSMLHDE